ncbi:hypothetical protein [Tengunoibacter tsumagoiensis]|uniref:hypothetical protein n=1 Tax=Tengunoibacter tsumagoiensis TaxID=2014871 RepID=UPI0013870902|nr:hypothetical protein [Tengunoibacter tsumagoiensis]
MKRTMAYRLLRAVRTQRESALQDGRHDQDFAVGGRRPVFVVKPSITIAHRQNNRG